MRVRDGRMIFKPLSLSGNRARARMDISAIFTRSVRLVAWPWVVHASEDEFRFRFSGDLGLAYELQQSTDLISWQSVGFLTNVFGAVQYGDPFQDTAPQRFYRLVILP